MIKEKVRFNDALDFAVKFILTNAKISELSPVILRDVHGRIRLFIEKDLSDISADNLKLLEGLRVGLGIFFGGTALFKDDFYKADAIFQKQNIVELLIPGQEKTVRILDRQITGQDWLRPQLNERDHPTRLVFYGLKGGVGRSTALTMLAYHLGRAGKRVLLLDLDLESPGLSSLLLPTERLAEFGLVDWFIEDAVGQGDDVLNQLVSLSPLSAYTQGEIRIAAAMGAKETAYLSKLSRVYGDAIYHGANENFALRVKRLVESLEAQEKPDVVLIDSRAGLHDIAAVSIVGLSNYTFLFATDTVQSWEGYRLLFSHWQFHPAVLKNIRNRLVMIHALFPEQNQSFHADIFLEKSYTLFYETMYEPIEPGDRLTLEPFNYDLNDTVAPHYPMRIKWHGGFQEFDLALLEKGILTDADISLAYGNFLDGSTRLIRE